MKVAGLIVAAGLSSRMHDFKPMMKMGSTSIIKSVIATFKESDVDLIVVVTGFKASQLEEHLSNMDVICLRNNEYATTQMFDSVKIGLNYLKNTCDTVLFTPGDIPLFSSDSVRKLVDSGEKLAKPVCNGKGGHPLLLDSSLISSIVSFNQDGGLKAAIQALKIEVKKIEVNDKGVLLDADTKDQYNNLLSFYNSKN